MFATVGRRAAAVRSVGARRTFTSGRSPPPLPSLFRLGDEIRQALADGRGVVALESTLITHGLPPPENFRVADRLESIVRAEDAVPATIALLDGRIYVGLTAAELERIADTTHSRPAKASLRDICNVLATRGVGGTTVAATMWIAHQAGIKLFATGGIGGVHLGAEQSFDISADLTELGRIPVAVVCAGAKSILDIGKTLEVLETNSVNVVVLAEDAAFPGFFTPRTPHRAPFHTESLATVVDVLAYGSELNLQGGTLIACPVPSEFATDAEFVERCVGQAVREAATVSSKDVTPFILRRVNELSGAKSMSINIALLANNASIAARLANVYAERMRVKPFQPVVQAQPSSSASSTQLDRDRRRPNVLCIGSAILDIEAITTAHTLKSTGAYYPGEVHMRAGGVARNHAEALAKLGCDVHFLSVTGDDAFDPILRANSPAVDFSNVRSLVGKRTASSIGINVLGDVGYGFIDVDELMYGLTPQMIEDDEQLFAAADFVLVDANLTVNALHAAVSVATRNNKPVWFEPTNHLKASKIFERQIWPLVSAASPNAAEFRVLCDELGRPVTDTVVADPTALMHFLRHVNDDIGGTLLSRLFAGRLQWLIVTFDSFGSLLVHRSPKPDGDISFRVLPPVEIHCEEIVSVSGAGDCFNSGYLVGHLRGFSDKKCVELATRCAAASLRSMVTAPDSLTDIACEFGL